MKLFVFEAACHLTPVRSSFVQTHAEDRAVVAAIVPAVDAGAHGVQDDVVAANVVEQDGVVVAAAASAAAPTTNHSAPAPPSSPLSFLANRVPSASAIVYSAVLRTSIDVSKLD